MIVNKSMFPIQTGVGVISKLQSRFSDLQEQLGTGMKTSTLAGMGSDLAMSLSVRSRLSKIDGFANNIATVNLRLSFLDKTMSRFDKIEGEARNSAVQGQYGTNNINMATLPGLSKARLDEVVTMLNSDVAGRYLFGGSNTDTAPLPDTTSLLEGIGGKDGYKTVVGERKSADLGLSGLGRVEVSQPSTNAVALTEDGDHPFGFKLLRVTSTASPAAVSASVVAPSATVIPPLQQPGDTTTITFAAAPADQIRVGETITLGVQLPDGTDTQLTLRAISADDAPAGAGQFVVGNDPDANAASFKTAMEGALKLAAGTELAAASTFAASTMFFNGPGEPALRVDGDPATATSLRVATAGDTVLWYRGQSPAISAEGLGRLDIAANGPTVALSEKAPASAAHGFQIDAISGSAGSIVTTPPGASPSNVTVEFSSVPAPGETVQITLKEPNGTTRTLDLKAVNGRAGPGQFTIGADTTATAANFANALTVVITDAAIVAEGNPRQSITAQVDDSTRVAYGMEANESGFLRMMRTLSALAIETYPDSDPTAKGRFDGMASRQQSQLSESHNSEKGSLEILAMELGVAYGTLESSTQRHTDYKAQLENLLSDVETVSKEQTAMELLALQTRLQASYQVTSMVANLSLVNYM